jgi:hypothetical protein
VTLIFYHGSSVWVRGRRVRKLNMDRIERAEHNASLAGFREKFMHPRSLRRRKSMTP